MNDIPGFPTDDDFEPVTMMIPADTDIPQGQAAAAREAVALVLHHARGDGHAFGLSVPEVVRSDFHAWYVVSALAGWVGEYVSTQAGGVEQWAHDALSRIDAALEDEGL